MKKVPVGELLVARGFFEDKKDAASWIMSGSVLVNDCRADTPGQRVDPSSDIRIRGFSQKYVSKGGLKLEGALSDFGIDVRGLTAIDAGASTGGFTDCLIQHGAEKVYAVDVGFGQLVGKLRIDPRVVNMEKVNIGDIEPGSLDPKPSFATVDLSYLSLKKAIPIFAGLLKCEGEMVCLVKPLFEVADSSLRRSGDIEDPGVYRELLTDLADYPSGLGFQTTGITYSHVTGNKGTREFFMRISLGGAADGGYSPARLHEDIEKSVECVMKIKPFQKK